MAGQQSCPICRCSEVTPISNHSFSAQTEPTVLAFRCENGHRFLAQKKGDTESRESAAETNLTKPAQRYRSGTLQKGGFRDS